MTDEEYMEAARPLVKRWRKKPVVVEAVKWDGSDLAEEALNDVLGLDPLTLIKETCPAFCAWCGRKDICGGRNRAVEVYGDDDDD